MLQYIPPETITQILSGIGSLVGLLLLWLIGEAIRWARTKISRERSEQLAAAIDKLVMFGVTQAEDMIRKRGPEGWADPNVKSFVKRTALKALPEKFPDALKHSRLDVNRSKDRKQIEDAIERAIPEVFARAAASPATPPAVQAPIAAVVVGGEARP